MTKAFMCMGRIVVSNGSPRQGKVTQLLLSQTLLPEERRTAGMTMVVFSRPV